MRQLAVILMAIGGLTLGCGSDGDGGTTPMGGQQAAPAPGNTGVTPGTNPGTTPPSTATPPPMGQGNGGNVNGGTGATGTGNTGTGNMNQGNMGTNPMVPPPMQMLNCPEGQQPVNGACQPVEAPQMGEFDSIVGKYIFQTKVVTIQTVPLFGDQKNTTTLYGYMDITKDAAGQFVATEYGCGGGALTEGGIRVIIDQSLAEIIPDIVTPIEVFTAGGEKRFARAEVGVSVGINLVDPLNEALPNDKMDPRIVDADMDSKPGITIQVKVEDASLASLVGGADQQIYVAQVNRNSLSGAIQGDGKLSGLTVDRSEQLILGGSSAVLEMDLPSRPGNNPAENTFLAVPVDNAAIDCNWVTANQGMYFP